MSRYLLELIRHFGDGNVEDVHFIAFDEIEQQIQRPAKGVENDLIITVGFHAAAPS
jgi:hypothetical protein